MNETLSKIIQLINTDNFYEAEQELRKIYNANSNSFDINKILGAALLAQRKYSTALKCYEKCYHKDQNDYDVVVNLSFIFLKIQFYENSIDFCKKAISLNSNAAHSYQNLATCYFHLSDYGNAEKYALEAISKRGGMESKNFLATEDLVSLYSNILLAQRRNNDFVEYANKILNRHYIQRLLIMLLREERKLISNTHIEMAHDAIKSAPNLDKKIERNTKISDAYFFLAEYYSKDNQKLSEEYYVKANKVISDMQRESIFIRQKISKSIYEFFREFDSKDLESKIDNQKGKGLIFVLGMPRSGTTLVESILSTAQSLQPGGEKSFFSLQLFESITGLVNGNEIDMSLDYIKSLGDRYMEHIQAQKKSSEFFVAKLPENYLYIKFIKLCLPGAKFIHCNRDPWDNAISLFKQNYSINIFYASSFFGIATEIANQEFLMNFWKKLYPEEDILTLNYEDLIADEKNTAEIIWKFFGLQGAYDPTKRKEYVGYTASMQQVTKDIYTTSVGKEEFLIQKEEFISDLSNQRDFWQNRIQ